MRDTAIFAPVIGMMLLTLAVWWFFGFRIVRSFNHCTTNVVPQRFGAYMLSAMGLWFMVVRAAIQGFS
jgi:hypothetical protein